MRRHKLPSPFLSYPQMGCLELTAVRLIVRFAFPRREHSHDGSVAKFVTQLTPKVVETAEEFW